MEWNEKVHSSGSLQVNADWKGEVNLLENYPEYRLKFIQSIERFFTWRDGHLERIRVANYRIKLTLEENTIK